MTRTRLFIITGALVGAALLVPTYVYAQTTATLNVTANVAARCTITAATLAFGAYDPIVANLTAALDGTTTFTVTCTQGGANVFVGASLGVNALGSVRRLKSGTADFLTYELYREPGRTTIWGTTQAAGLAVVPDGTTPVTMSVYGRIAGAQDSPVGTYSDTVVMTVNF